MFTTPECIHILLSLLLLLLLYLSEVQLLLLIARHGYASSLVLEIRTSNLIFNQTRAENGTQLSTLKWKPDLLQTGICLW